jgi:hypothetical protein
METIGFIGIGKIGLPICENLIKSGYRVVGFRRSSLADFEKIGGMPAKSPAEVGEQANFVFSCVPSSLLRVRKRRVFACPVLYRSGAPDKIRTCDLCLRRAALYPAELRARVA